MDYNKTEIIAILDMSGSMHGLTGDTIGGYNALLEEQKKQEGEANITTVLFDDRYIVLHDREDIRKVSPLTDKEYCPMGTTAMLDAIGKTLVSVGQKLAAMKEEERPGLVSVTIITDGYENASREYDWKTVQSMIREQKEKYNWIFTFIGADIDTMEVSKNLGIDAGMAKSYTKSKAGLDSVYKSVSQSISFSRSAAANYSVSNSVSGTALNTEDLADKISEILDNIE